MSDEKMVAVIVQHVAQRFRCFGGGRGSAWNPVTEALKDNPLTFAAGVDVAEVVRFVLETAGIEK